MEKKAVFIFILAALVFAASAKAWALTEDPFQKAYEEYQSNLNNYHLSYKEYQAAKEEYFSYQTLTAKTVAFEQMLSMLKTRSFVLSSYLNLIRIKLNAAESGNEAVYLSEFDQLRIGLGQEVGFYQQSEKDLSLKNSFKQLLDFSSEIESRYQKKTQSLINRSLLLLFSARVKTVTKAIYNQLGVFEEKINLLKGSSANVNKLNQWLEEARNKTSLAIENQTRIEKEIFTKETFDTANFENLYKLLLETAQLLEEVVFHQKEILGEMKTYPVEFFQTPTPIMPANEATSASETSACNTCGQR